MTHISISYQWGPPMAVVIITAAKEEGRQSCIKSFKSADGAGWGQMVGSNEDWMFAKLCH